MNGEPLPIQHGYPLRLIVPAWYAVASVKWLTAIDLIHKPFGGHYQADKYWYESQKDDAARRQKRSRRDEADAVSWDRALVRQLHARAEGNGDRLIILGAGHPRRDVLEGLAAGFEISRDRRSADCRAAG